MAALLRIMLMTSAKQLPMSQELQQQASRLARRWVRQRESKRHETQGGKMEGHALHPKAALEEDRSHLLHGSVHCAELPPALAGHVSLALSLCAPSAWEMEQEWLQVPMHALS